MEPPEHFDGQLHGAPVGIAPAEMHQLVGEDRLDLL